MSRADRTVHAYSADMEVVRYGRAGKWFLEPKDSDLPRQHVGVEDAARHALWLRDNAAGVILLGLGGGAGFDYRVRAAV